MICFCRDIQYALRSLGKSPGFTVVAVLTLALGIGANTAIFSVVDYVLLRTIPVEHPQSLVLLSPEGAKVGSSTGQNSFSYPMFRDLRDHNSVFSGLLCRARFNATLGYQGEAEWMFGELVSGNYFDLLGVEPAIGRTITPNDDQTPGAEPVIVLSYDLWVNRFGRDPEVVGKTLNVNNYPLTVIGVSDGAFDGIELGMRPRFWVPVMMARQMSPASTIADLENRRGSWLQVFGRLKPGVGLEQARASLQPLFHSILKAETTEQAFQGVSEIMKRRFLESRLDLLPGARGTPGIRDALRTPLWAVMGMVGVVLLAACVNLANLLIARASGRQAELATRMAIGAGRVRIARQLFTENLVLALLGGVAALLLSQWITQVLAGALPVPFMGDEPLKLGGMTDPHILGFTFLAALAAVVLFGLAPAILAARADPYPALRRQTTGGSGSAVLRKTLITGQVTLSLVLLIAAALFVRSLWNLQSLDPGFRTENIVTFAVDPTLHSYKPEEVRGFFRRLTARLREVPGIDGAAVGMVRLLADDVWTSGITVEGYQPQPDEDVRSRLNGVSPGYFGVLGTPLLEGRDFRDSDGADAPRVALVNESFARRYFRGRSAIGRSIALSNNPGAKTDIRIVGVVNDSNYETMRGEIPLQVFLPSDQLPFSFGMNTYVESRLPPEQISAAVLNVVRELDPSLPVFEMRTMEQQRNRSLAVERLVASLTISFGALAALLTSIGLYGILSYSVARRTRELGLRMALGARATSVIWLVVREVLLLLAAGAAVAIPVAMALGRFVESQLYGVAPNDPRMIGLATVLLALVSAVAVAIPTRRAIRIPPIEALRYE